MTSVLPVPLPAAPGGSTENASGLSAKSALARSLTGTLAFYFKRPIRLFRPTRISAWTAFNEIASAQGHKSVDASFLRRVIGKQGWLFFLREALPPLLVNSAVGFTLFSTYTLTEAGLKYLPPGTVSPYAVPFLAGSVAGAAQSVISSPLDNVRSILAASSSSKAKNHWPGWRQVAVQALFPKWLTSTTPVTSTPFLFLVNWWRSSWSLFIFTLARDSLGFGAFFTIFELSRALAKRAGKSIDRLQTRIEARSKSIGIDLQHLMENDLIGRGWPGRAVQAFVIVFCGIFAGIGYGLVGRPFDKARTVIWNGLTTWAKARKAAEEEQLQRMQSQEAIRAQAASLGSEAIGAVKRSSNAPRIATGMPLAISHRTRHARANLHETRLPLHPPRPAEPPKHPLKEPSKIQTDLAASSRVAPSAMFLLRQAYRKEGLLPMLGFSSTSTGIIRSVLPSRSVYSRRQLAKSGQTEPKSTRAVESRPSAAPLTLESLSEHPALGGTAVFDHLPDPSDPSLLKKAHRRPRWWQLSKSKRSTTIAPIQRTRVHWRSKLTVANFFRIVPPYCIGFLVYSMMTDDFTT